MQRIFNALNQVGASICLELVLTRCSHLGFSGERLLFNDWIRSPAAVVFTLTDIRQTLGVATGMVRAAAVWGTVVVGGTQSDSRDR